VNPELIANKPEYAEILQRLTETFARQYVFKDDRERATFVEGLKELAMLVVGDSKLASIDVKCGGNGISAINVSVVSVP